MNRHLRRWAYSLVSAVLAFNGAASAQDKPADYPSKPIQFVICYAPGGGVDVVGRIVA